MQKLLTVLLVLQILVFGSYRSARAEAPGQVIASPDGALRALIIPLHNNGGFEESRVEIHGTGDKLLCTKDDSSNEGEHGLKVEKGRWTPDSRFFVYNTTSSGGHQAWHSPTFFYSRANNRIRNLEEVSHRVVLDQTPDPTFKIVPPHSVATVSPGALYGVKGFGKDNDFVVLVNLETGAVSQQTKWPDKALP
ncbi:hypothetical protein [Candidatus Binatus soli]|uniref:hypothetical protein n=1 Tax=Candidatus Binatus soli TaxID=1953413 RepID=UPI003D146DE5